MIITTKYRDKPDVKETGGKGMNLLLLKQEGYPVPDFVIIPVSFFEQYRGSAEDELKHHVQSLIGSISPHFNTGDLLAVRSSAVAEDSGQFSFAGQFKTVLNVPQEDIANAVLAVWFSAQGKELEAYKTHSGSDAIQMAVVIQKMIPATAAGVAFGINPLTGNKEEVVINAVNGLGEGLVSGDRNADAYTLSNALITEKRVVGSTQVLSDKQLLQIGNLLTELNTFYRKPQDIEFAYKDDVFYLLQSRPVTSIQFEKQKIIWDNSNIVESYPGLTLPLTFSFIEKMYDAVYRQLSMVLGIPEKKVQQHADVYANMLGLLNGRVYYNLNSWYKVLSLLPGYNINSEFMERMMGVKEKLELPLEDKIAQHRIWDYWDILLAVRAILGNLITVKKQKLEFIDGFNKVYEQYRYKDYSKADLVEIWNDYQSFEQLMVEKWKAPLVNDFFAMIYFGLLQKQTAKHFPEQKDIHNRLVSFSEDIITTQPLKKIPQLVKLLLQDNNVKQLFLNNDTAYIWKELKRPAYGNYLQAINEYLDEWGERCVAELKLETITYQQQPEKFIAILQSYIKNSVTEYITSDDSAGLKKEAEEIVRKYFRWSPVKRSLFNHVLGLARYLVSNRENLRYYRTRGFGMVRKMMCAFGKHMQTMGLLADSRDVFYLELEELNAVAANKLNANNIAALIGQRKKDFELYKQLSLPERVVTAGKQTTIVLSEQEDLSDTSSLIMTGIPCCRGVVQAKVRTVHYSGEVESLKGEIMATYATDPGWVVLFPTVSGIITERGSLLSHAAIVSREMGIPCIVGIAGLMNKLKDGDEIIMDGSTGVVKIIKRATEA